MSLRLLSRLLLSAALLVVVAAFSATVVWALATIFVRPIDGVEGEVLFEASRLRHGLPLYTNIDVATFDYGPVPARYLVLYPPVWSTIVARIPEGWALGFARISGTAAWFGLLGWISLRAPRERRRVCMSFALFVAGVWVLALYGASGRPDAIAVLASGVALDRVTRKASVRGPAIDAVTGALFVLAAWVKPNVIGIAPGVFIAAFVAAYGPRSARARSTRAVRAFRAVAPGVLGAVLTCAAFVAVFTLATGHAWLEHLLASTGQPPSLELWLDQMGSRAPFLGLPLAAVMVVGARGLRTHNAGTALAFGALVTATAWCVLSLSKIGSASNYLLEPCVAAVVVLARTDLPSLTTRSLSIVSVAALVQALWTGVASVRSSLEHVPLDRERAAVILDARRLCGAPADAVILADEPGLELMMNGRIVQTPFQSTHLARRGRFPKAAWLADVSRPEAACLVMQDDLLERPLDRVNIEHDRFDPELRRALASRFALVTERAGLHVYTARPAAP